MSCNISKSTHRKDQDNYQYFISRTAIACVSGKISFWTQRNRKKSCLNNINVKHKGLLNIKEERTMIQGSCVERTSYTQKTESKNMLSKTQMVKNYMNFVTYAQYCVKLAIWYLPKFHVKLNENFTWFKCKFEMPWTTSACDEQDGPLIVWFPNRNFASGTSTWEITLQDSGLYLYLVNIVEGRFWLVRM